MCMTLCAYAWQLLFCSCMFPSVKIFCIVNVISTRLVQFLIKESLEMCSCTVLLGNNSLYYKERFTSLFSCWQRQLVLPVPLKRLPMIVLLKQCHEMHAMFQTTCVICGLTKSPLPALTTQDLDLMGFCIITLVQLLDLNVSIAIMQGKSFIDQLSFSICSFDIDTVCSCAYTSSMGPGKALQQIDAWMKTHNSIIMPYFTQGEYWYIQKVIKHLTTIWQS